MAEKMNILITRAPSTENGTFGILSIDGVPTCLTCELPWLNNAPDKSCIPIGSYTAIRHDSPDHPHTWEVQNVPNRTGILLHNGNTKNDSLGCIIVGSSFGTVDSLPAVLNSNTTLANLQEDLPDSFNITIT